jgi:photosystem II stability/assembly factor-like uncharacterized protein
MKPTLTTIILLLISKFCFAQVATMEKEDFWMEISRPVNAGVYSLVIDAELNIIAGMGNDNGVYLSNNNGESWQPIGLENIEIYSLHIHQNGNIFAGTGGFNTIYRLSNLEEGWTPVYSCVPNIISLASNMQGALFAGSGGNYGLLRSTNNGDDWDQIITLTDTEQTNAIFPYSTNKVFIGTADFMGGGGVYHSMDNGDTWEHVGLHNKYISSLAVSSTGVLFAGSRGDHEFGGGGVYRSLDQGNTWEEVANNVWVTSMAIDPNDVLYIGCPFDGGQGGVLRTSDNGETWELLVAGMSIADVDGLSLSPDGFLYAYSRWALYRSVERVFIPNTATIQHSNPIKVYPNPFTDAVTVELPNEQPLHGPLSVRVIDPLGRVVYSNSLSSPKYVTVILSTLPPGLYYISIELNGQRYTKPIVKVCR